MKWTSVPKAVYDRLLHEYRKYPEYELSYVYLMTASGEYRMTPEGVTHKPTGSDEWIPCLIVKL